jgi:hypothetical protein
MVVQLSAISRSIGALLGSPHDSRASKGRSPDYYK